MDMKSFARSIASGVASSLIITKSLLDWQFDKIRLGTRLRKKTQRHSSILAPIDR